MSSRLAGRPIRAELRRTQHRKHLTFQLVVETCLLMRAGRAMSYPDVATRALSFCVRCTPKTLVCRYLFVAGTSETDDIFKCDSHIGPHGTYRWKIARRLKKRTWRSPLLTETKRAGRKKLSRGTRAGIPADRIRNATGLPLETEPPDQANRNGCQYLRLLNLQLLITLPLAIQE